MERSVLRPLGAFIIVSKMLTHLSKNFISGRPFIDETLRLFPPVPLK
jgi:hypothetical protein